jgi:CheY-like chemotaxis protein
MSSLPTKKALIVDDDADILFLIGTILQSLGYATLKAESPIKALEIMEKESVDVALLDIMMPEMDGYQLLERLRLLPHCHSIPVFMVTARHSELEVMEGYAKGADYFICKPFTSQQISYGLSLFLDQKGKVEPT